MDIPSGHARQPDLSKTLVPVQGNTINAPIDWLLTGPAYVRLRTRLDLLSQSPQDPGVVEDRKAMLTLPAVSDIINRLTDWPVQPINSHKSAGHPLHLLTFLADLGFNQADPGIGSILDQVTQHQHPDGPFMLVMNIPKHFGGPGVDAWSWGLCDAPLLVYALSSMGLKSDPRVQAALDFLTRLVRDNGWPCAGSTDWGTFRGPGRKDDPCPYATLVMLKALSIREDTRSLPAVHFGIEAILHQWEYSYEHPYLFRMGTDFRKLKAPLVWFDLLHVLDVLTRFPAARRDPRLGHMLALLQSKASPEGKYTPESVWMAWKGWDFAQKNEPSYWLTFLAWRILSRMS